MDLERIFKVIDRTFETAFGVFELLLLIGAAGLGGFVLWSIAGIAEADLLMRLAVTVTGAVIAVVITWVAWSILKVTGG